MNNLNRKNLDEKPAPEYMAKEEDDDASSERKLILGRYEMGKTLGKGTFSKVHHGRDLRTGESVAIKVISKDLVRRDPSLAAQIQREVSAMRLLRHPHVIHLREVLATRSRVFFVMDHARGGELFARVVRGRLPENQVRRYFRQLLSAVDFCHSRGVCHRDLKPENLLLDHDGNLQVSDFGLSALPDQIRQDGLLHTQCGTPAYVAPEVLRRRGYDGFRADVWSCGVILFVLLAGFLPFQDENLMKMYSKIFRADYQIPPWFSTDARRLVARLLVVDPQKRPSIAAVLDLPWLKRAALIPRSISAPAVIFPTVDRDDNNEIQTSGGGDQSPRFCNAFELISAMAGGWDLSGLFEARKKAGTVFASRRPAAEILEGLERAGRGLGFKMERGKKGCEMRMEKKEGRKGRLEVAAEVREAAAELAVVEFCKIAGDEMEFERFCDEDVRPRLRDIVWVWQGDDTMPIDDTGERSFR